MKNWRPSMKSVAFLGSILLLVWTLSGCGGGEGGSQTAGQGAAEGKKVIYWKSGMDPSFVSQRPGKDAMGMELIPVYEGDPGANLTSIIVSGLTLQRMAVRTYEIVPKNLERSIRSVATINYDESTLSLVNSKFEGWIEKLYVDETGQYVRAGSPLFDIYSPELQASAEEYLQALLGNPKLPHVEHLIESARNRLEQFDVPNSVIDRIAKTKKVPRILTIRAPKSGYVIHKNALQGSYVNKHETLFRIADLRKIWVLVDVYEYELPWLKLVKDADMELTYVPGRTFKGKIDYVYPFLNLQSRTVKVRIVFKNPDLILKPGMFASVWLRAKTKDPVLVVPSEAVIHSGKRNVVFVSQGDGSFEARDLKIGRTGDGGDYEVLKGLEPGDLVVTSGQFLLDSESRLKEAVAKMLGTNLPADPEDEPVQPEPEKAGEGDKPDQGK